MAFLIGFVFLFEVINPSTAFVRVAPEPTKTFKAAFNIPASSALFAASTADDLPAPIGPDHRMHSHTPRSHAAQPAAELTFTPVFLATQFALAPVLGDAETHLSLIPRPPIA